MINYDTLLFEPSYSLHIILTSPSFAPNIRLLSFLVTPRSLRSYRLFHLWEQTVPPMETDCSLSKNY